MKKSLVSNDDAEISHSIPNILHFLERELRHKTRFQETAEIAGEILVSATPTVALKTLLFCWKSLGRNNTDLQTPRLHSKATEVIVYGYPDYTTAIKQWHMDGTTAKGDTV